MVRGRRTSVAPDSLVEVEPLRPEGALPLLVRPVVEGVDLIEWCRSNREWIREKLLESGGTLFRGFAVRTPAASSG